MSFPYSRSKAAGVHAFTALMCLLWVEAAAPVTVHSASACPDYYVSSNVDPYFATGPITIVYSATQNDQASRSLVLTSQPSPPPNPAGIFLTDSDIHAVPALPRPAPRTPLVDQVFGATVTRLTDPSMDPADTSGPVLGLRHEYARYPAINADNSKVIVTVLGGAYRGSFEIRDLASGSLLHRLSVSGDPEFSWHPTDSTRLLYRFANQIRVFHPDSGQNETLMTFPQYYYISTREEGRPSDDWRYYAFVGYHDSSFSSADIVVVDLVTKQVTATWPNSGIPDWVSMSPTGTYVVAQWTTGEGTRLYNRNDLSYVRTLFSDFAHSDFALDANGNEVIVYHPTSAKQIAELGNPNGSPLAMAQLATGQKTIVLTIGWEWFTPHFSGIASRAHPGWVLVSTYTDPQNA
ncbi:MAG: hypothetical protein HYZ72_17390, partial [Deltaproteobacteria bacterium]|nr:hypothetical protein [Deltaproteobacteria bacterium]